MANTFNVWTPFTRNEDFLPAFSGQFYSSTCLNAVRSALRKFGVSGKVVPIHSIGPFPRSYRVGNVIWFVQPVEG